MNVFYFCYVTSYGNCLLFLVMAASSIANIVKSSLGPVGLDKMLVDDIGDVTVTNDGATILRLLEVEHPAAKYVLQFHIIILYFISIILFVEF